jgi:hypothetical protein
MLDELVKCEISRVFVYREIGCVSARAQILASALSPPLVTMVSIDYEMNKGWILAFEVIKCPSFVIIKAPVISPVIHVWKMVEGIQTSRGSEDAGVSSQRCFRFELLATPRGCWSSCRADSVVAVSSVTGNRTLHSGMPLASVRLRMTSGMALGFKAFEVEVDGAVTLVKSVSMQGQGYTGLVTLSVHPANCRT